MIRPLVMVCCPLQAILDTQEQSQSMILVCHQAIHAKRPALYAWVLKALVSKLVRS
jgi:hypothetical protein